jgi:curved DNA-binding protein CbpA
VTYYHLLGVSPSASPEEIRRAYHRAIRRYHPDVNKAADAARLTIRLNDAWATLRDSTSRAEYDRRINAATLEPHAWQSPHDASASSAEAHAYWSAPYQATVVNAPYGAPLARYLAGGLRVLVLVAFVASVVQWFPLVVTICVALLAARVLSRAFR